MIIFVLLWLRFKTKNELLLLVYEAFLENCFRGIHNISSKNYTSKGTDEDKNLVLKGCNVVRDGVAAFFYRICLFLHLII